MSKISYSEMQSRLDLWIRQGRLAEARAELKALSPKIIPRAYAYPMADLARRAVIPLVAIKILNPIVRPKYPLHPSASTTEKALYAAALALIGARKEARELLAPLDGSRNPEVYFYWLYVLLPEWEYQKAIPVLKRYVRSSAITTYQRLVGLLNLAACFVFVGDFRQAQRTLNRVLQSARQEQAQMIYNNSLELQAQIFLNQNKFDQAEQSLQAYAKSASSSTDIYHLYAEKWQTVLDLKKNGPSEKALTKMQGLREKAKIIENFETLRDLDYQEAQNTGNSDKRSIVFLGTPYPAYRKRILHNLSGSQNLPSKLLFDLFSRQKVEATRFFSISLGRFSDGSCPLKQGQILHRCLRVLVRDLYQPTSLGLLFSELFQEDYFNPTSSPTRVYQTIHRLNNWFKKQSIPLFIRTLKNQFLLTAESEFVIEIKKENSPIMAQSSHLALLKDAFSKGFFCSSQAAKVLNLEQRQVQNVLQNAVRNHLVMRLGKGRTTFYKIISNPSRKPVSNTG